MSILDRSVTKADDDTWTFQCPGVVGSLCGPSDGPTFSSSGWPTKKLAMARGAQHFEDHKGTPMPELAEFRKEHGLVVDDDGMVKVEDL